MPLNIIKLKHQLNGLKSLGVNSMLQKLHHGSQRQNLQPLYLEGHIFYSVSFSYKGERHGWGRGGGRRKSTSSIQGIAAVIANGPGEPIISCYARLFLPGVPVTWFLPSLPAGVPRSTSTTLFSRTVEPRG